MDREKTWLQAICLVIVATSALMTFQGQERYLRGFVVDDALYYPVIARNIVDHGVQSFDRLTVTNGFHPLLGYLLTAAFAISPLEAAADLWTLRILILAVNLGAVYVYVRLLQRGGFRPFAIAAFLLTMFIFWRPFITYYSGLETGLVNLWIGASLWAVLRLRDSPSVSRAILGGVMLALAFLARLDSIFIIGLIALYALGVVLRGRFRQQLALVLSGLVLALPYVLSNLVVFGNVVPGSGLRKMAVGGSSTSALGEILYTVERRIFAILPSTAVSHTLTGLAVLLAVVCVAIFFRQVFRRDRGTLDELFALCGIGALLHFGYITFFMVEGHVSWYHYQIYLLVAVAAAYAVQWFPAESKSAGRSPYLPVALTFYLVALLALWGYKFYANPQQINAAAANIQLGKWARDRTLREAVFLMYDPGIFAYYAQRRTITLNALAGDRFIRECFRENDLQKIIERFHPDFVVVEQSVTLPSANRFHTAFPPDQALFATFEYRRGHSTLRNTVFPASLLTALGVKEYLP